MPLSDASAALTALVIVVLLGFVLRWVFRPSRTPRGAPVDASESTELGLLTVVASGLRRSDAIADRARLGDAGIRSSMSRRRDGTMDVLVFHADVDQARRLLDR